MDSMEIDTSKPWYVEQKSFDYHFEGYSSGHKVKKIMPVQIKLVNDSDRCKNRIGSIIKFESSYERLWLNDWQDWFLTKRDKNKKRKRIKWKPLYCSNQYGIIANSYKRIKSKSYGCVYSDYGRKIILLTGPRIGAVRTVYMQSPYSLFCPFENIPKLKRLKLPYKTKSNNVFLDDLNINKISSEVINQLGVTEQARRKFVNILYENLVRLGYVR